VSAASTGDVARERAARCSMFTSFRGQDLRSGLMGSLDSSQRQTVAPCGDQAFVVGAPIKRSSVPQSNVCRCLNQSPSVLIKRLLHVSSTTVAARIDDRRCTDRRPSLHGSTTVAARFDGRRCTHLTSVGIETSLCSCQTTVDASTNGGPIRVHHVRSHSARRLNRDSSSRNASFRCQIDLLQKISNLHCEGPVDQQKSSRGGARPGAGRKKSNRRRHDPPHRARAELASTTPVHVVLRTEGYVPRLRTEKTYRATHAVFARYQGLDDFRIVHGSIQSNHFHLLLEAAHKLALSRGMNSLTVNLARAINEATGGYGRVFEHRYHDTQITTPLQARNAIAYVLNNWRKHGEDLANARTMAAKLDPYASGLSFDGWSSDGVRVPRFSIPPGYDPLPVSPPTTALLRSEWQLHGLIELFETPGPLRGWGAPAPRPRHDRNAALTCPTSTTSP